MAFKKHRPKCKYSNKETLVRGLVLYECEQRGIDFDSLNDKEIYEIYEEIINERKEKRNDII